MGRLPSRTQAWWKKPPSRIRSRRSFAKVLLSNFVAASIAHDSRTSLRVDHRGSPAGQPFHRVAGDEAASSRRVRRHKQSAIRINELARRIHSEADASAVVSEIAGVFAKELPPAWTSGSIRQRVAHAEYESVRNWRSCLPNERRSKTDPFERAACEKPTSLPSRGPRPRSLLQSCPSPRGQK